MRVSEFINVLRSYNPDHELMISSEEDLWSIDQASFREATLHETDGNILVDSVDYNSQEDGKITSTKEVVLIDLDM